MCVHVCLLTGNLKWKNIQQDNCKHFDLFVDLITHTSIYLFIYLFIYLLMF